MSRNLSTRIHCAQARQLLWLQQARSGSAASTGDPLLPDTAQTSPQSALDPSDRRQGGFSARTTAATACLPKRHGGSSGESAPASYTDMEGYAQADRLNFGLHTWEEPLGCGSGSIDWDGAFAVTSGTDGVAFGQPALPLPPAPFVTHVPAGPCHQPEVKLDMDTLTSMEYLPSLFWECTVPQLVSADDPAPAGSGCCSAGGTTTASGSGASSDGVRGRAKAGGSASGRYSKPEARARKQEQQRQYRQRCKQRTTQQAGQLEAAAAALKAARKEQAELLRHQDALLKLQQCREIMSESLQRAEPDTADYSGATNSEESSGGTTIAASPVTVWEADALAIWTPTLSVEIGTGVVLPTTVSAVLDAAIGGFEQEEARERMLLLPGSCQEQESGHYGYCQALCDFEEQHEQQPLPVKESLQLGPQQQHAYQHPSPGSKHDSVGSPSSGKGGGAVGAWLASKVLCTVPEAVWKRLLQLGERRLRGLVQNMTPSDFAARNKGFCSLIQAALEEWEVSAPAERCRVERRLHVLWAIRWSAGTMMAELKPEVLCQVLQANLLPPPAQQQALGSNAASCPVNHLLLPVVEQLRITPHQRRGILMAWQKYQLRVAATRQLSRQGIHSMREAEACKQQRRKSSDKPLSAAMQEYLAAYESAAELAMLPRQEAAAWMHLASAVHQALTPLQSSRLLLAVMPHMIDVTQLCQLLEWQQQQALHEQQLHRQHQQMTAAVADPGHLLAGATLTVR